jgi:hypothetical protein
MASTHFSGPVISADGFEGDVTGDVTGDLTGLAFQGASTTVIKASGALPITNLFSLVYPAGADGSAPITLTLADGQAGQMKIVKYDDGTGSTTDVIIHPTNFADGYRFTLDAPQDVAVLVFDGAEWHTVYSDGTIDAAS